ncbi:MAG: carbohydrate ABC transporter permease [Thermomicrobiales bacterium]
MSTDAYSASGQLITPLRRGKSLGQLGLYLFLLPAIVYISLTMLYPVYENIRMSLHDVTIRTFLSDNQPWIGLDNFRTVFRDDAFWKAARLSLIFTGVSLLFQFTIGFLLALLFSQPFPGNGFLRSLMLLGWLMPTVLSGTIFKWVLDGDYGVLNYALTSMNLINNDRYWLIDTQTALYGTILANIWVGIPFNMLLLLGGLQGISTTLYEAASTDGAGAWQRFRTITVPLMRPVSLSVLLLGLIYTFKVFDLVYIMTGGGPVDATTVLPIYTYQKTFSFFKFGEGAAAAVALLAALLVVAAVYVWYTQREEVAS